MAALGSSGSGRRGRTRAKNQEMAADMKRNGVVRNTGRCPVCYAIVPNGKHIYACRGPKPRG